MVLNSLDQKTGGIIKLTYESEAFNRSFFVENAENVLTIVWNKGVDQQVDVDDTKVLLRSNHVIVLNANQSFRFDKAKDIIAWQFNREFYCIVDHDHEVSCAGLLFYGANGVPIIRLNDSDARKFDVLFQVFLDEFGEVEDNLKSEMLRVILKRLIVKLTRSYKVQNSLSSIENKDMDVVRQFNLMVEKNYRELHQVQDYADLLNRSSKTISNIFSKYSEESPLETIHKRVLLEAKRLLIYTDKTTKEVAYGIGFQDIPSFSRFFKKHTQLAPSKFREKHRFDLIGKN